MSWLPSFETLGTRNWSHCWKERDDQYFFFTLQSTGGEIRIWWYVSDGYILGTEAEGYYPNGWGPHVPARYIAWSGHSMTQIQKAVAFFDELVAGNPLPFIMERML